MKNNKKHIILLYLIILVLAGVNIISNRNIIFNNKIILKNMDESTQIADKEKAIDELNKTHAEYYNYIQTAKQEIASAIRDMGVPTSDDETLEDMATNIRNIKNMREITGSFNLYSTSLNRGSGICVNTEGYTTAIIYNNRGAGGDYDYLNVYGLDEPNLTMDPTGTLLGNVKHQETVSFDISGYKYVQIFYSQANNYFSVLIDNIYGLLNHNQKQVDPIVLFNNDETFSDFGNYFVNIANGRVQKSDRDLLKKEMPNTLNNGMFNQNIMESDIPVNMNAYPNENITEEEQVQGKTRTLKKENHGEPGFVSYVLLGVVIAVMSLIFLYMLI